MSASRTGLIQTKFLLSDRDRKRLQALSRAYEMPMTDVIRQLIREAHRALHKENNNGNRKKDPG